MCFVRWWPYTLPRPEKKRCMCIEKKIEGMKRTKKQDERKGSVFAGGKEKKGGQSTLVMLNLWQMVFSRAFLPIIFERFCFKQILYVIHLSAPACSPFHHTKYLYDRLTFL